jgi:molybdate transport system ATP-binding protein
MLKVAIRKRLAAFDLDVRFELPTPGVAALFGPSGCGKTSTVSAIAGLLEPDEGTIELDSQVLLDTTRGRCVPVEQRRVAYIFQHARLFPHLSVAGNLRYALKRAPPARFVDMDEVIELLELKHLLERRTQHLSGGERQRVAIARALLSQPRLLLLDEPLASLDRERRDEVLPYLESLRDRLSLPMVYVSHRFEEVLRLATHVVLMQSGRVTAQGDIGAISLDASLRSLIDPDAVGAVMDGRVLGIEAQSGLTRISLGRGEIKLGTQGWPTGTAVRVQLLARDIIVARRLPDQLSVRNHLAGTLTRIEPDGAHSDLVSIDVGGATLLARITRAATRELDLAPGLPAFALIKAASLHATRL